MFFFFFLWNNVTSNIFRNYLFHWIKFLLGSFDLKIHYRNMNKWKYFRLTFNSNGKKRWAMPSTVSRGSWRAVTTPWRAWTRTCNSNSLTIISCSRRAIAFCRQPMPRATGQVVYTLEKKIVWHKIPIIFSRQKKSSNQKIMCLIRLSHLSWFSNESRDRTIVTWVP